MSSLHDKIAQISYEHFKSLPKTGKPTDKEWTVLSTIVQMNKKENSDILTVVALGTGSKCIGRSKMSSNGDILHDSHAEVVCRRGFLRYLYAQMFAALQNDSESIFTFNYEESHNKFTLGNKFLLDEKITFHFFTTRVPCGDAAIFSKNSLNEVPNKKIKLDLDCRVNSSKSKLIDDNIGDIYRTGAKCLKGEDLKQSGENYHVTGVVRTKPGRGDPTLSVSCSDKLAKWCHLGIQGALLSLMLKKNIFLSTFTIAGKTPFCLEAFDRALYSRLGDVSEKLDIKEVPKIEIKQSNLEFQYQKSEVGLTDKENPCPSSVVWCRTKIRPLEVAVEGLKQGVTKKNQKTSKGRLLICKREFLATFVVLIQEMEKITGKGFKMSDKSNVKKLTLQEIKSLACDYQQKWNILKTEGFNAWTQKDPNLTDNFRTIYCR